MFLLLVLQKIPGPKIMRLRSNNRTLKPNISVKQGLKHKGWNQRQQNMGYRLYSTIGKAIFNGRSRDQFHAA